MPIAITILQPRQAAMIARAMHPTMALLLVLILWAPMSIAQPSADGIRPAASGRVVRAFDFEEQEINPLPVPLGWIRAQEDPDVPRVRPGFPIWNHAVLDYHSPAYAGMGSVRLPTNGGSTALMLRHGELNIFPNADYLISARVRTEGLSHASARVVATLLDQQGNEIEGSMSASPLVRSNDRWQQVSVEIEGLYPQAAFMKLELQLLQPEQQHPEQPVSPFTVWEQDFTGSASFDNLIIAQLPRLEITTSVAGNIVESESPPPLYVLVRDLTGDDIVARVRLFDVHAMEVAEKVLTDATRRVERQWTPPLPGYGWYRSLLEVFVGGQLVGVRTLDFIWAAPNQSNSESGMFSISTDITKPKLAAASSALIRGAGVNHASVRVWDQQTTQQSLLPGSEPMNAIDAMLEQKTGLSFKLAQLPAPLAITLAVDPHEVLSAFTDPNGPWSQWGAGMLDRYGQRVSQWQFGNNPTQESPETLIPAVLDAQRALSGFVPGPIITIPWSIDRPLSPELAAPNLKLLVIDDGTTSSLAMSAVVDEWVSQIAPSTEADDHPPRLGMVLTPMHAASDWSGVEVWSSVGSLARKAISFWWAASPSDVPDDRYEIQLSDAWWVSPGKRGQVMPAPELIVWRTLASHLGDRHALEELDLIDGVRMLVASPRDPSPDQTGQSEDSDSGALILWLDTPSIDPVTLSLPLALGPVRVFDVFENQTTINPVPKGNLGVPTHEIRIGRSPIIVEGINPELIRFLSNLRLSPDSLEARSGLHQHSVTITNPWPIPIQGRVFIVEPGGFTGKSSEIDRSWEILPRVFPFSLGPNEQQQLPVEIAYSLGELAGTKDLAFDVELQADKDYPVMRVRRSIELGLEGIELSLTARRNDAGITVVTASVINKRQSEQHFEIIAIAPNEPRVRRSINALPPGESASRQFGFTRAKPGDQIIVALMPRDTSTRLNKAVVVP